jgi:hypothetical protein
MYVLDVIVHTNVNVFPFPNPLFKSHPPIADRFDVADGLWIGKIEAEAARIVIDLNEPSFHRAQKPVVQFYQLYSYVREMKGPGNPYAWDTDGKLQEFVGISRLLLPMSVAVRYAGRIRYNTDNTIEDIAPANIRGVGLDTFLSEKPERDWLTEVDGVRLRELIGKIRSQHLPPRATRALWYHEYATRTFYVELRWLYVATALESLVHVGREYSGLQFRERVSQIAIELGISDFGPDEARQAYHLRSQLAHGQKLGGFAGPDRELYDSMETVLRRALLRAIEDADFSATLADDQKIRKRWPVCL